MSTDATVPELSVAVQVMLWTVPVTHDSAPFGAVTRHHRAARPRA